MDYTWLVMSVILIGGFTISLVGIYRSWRGEAEDKRKRETRTAALARPVRMLPPPVPKVEPPPKKAELKVVDFPEAQPGAVAAPKVDTPPSPPAPSTPAAVQPTAASNESSEDDLMAEVNAYRKSQGKPALQPGSVLAEMLGDDNRAG